MTSRIERITIEPRDGNWRVYGWGVWPASSVLAGQTFRQYITEEVSVDRCMAVIAERHAHLIWNIEVLDHPSAKPHVSVAHLPGPDDPVPGGMYPDDIGDWPPEP